MEEIGKTVTGLISRLQSSPTPTITPEQMPEVDPEVKARREQIRKADITDWSRKMRLLAIDILGDKPFTYDPAKCEKRTMVEDKAGWVIGGRPGFGKTMAMALKIDQVIKVCAPTYYNRDCPFLFTTASALWDRFHMGQAPDPLTPYVFIDDWGTEYREAFAVTRADAWFSARESHLGLSLFITTNLDKKLFMEQPGLERVASRIQGITDWISFTGKDQRKGWGNK